LNAQYYFGPSIFFGYKIEFIRREGYWGQGKPHGVVKVYTVVWVICWW